VPAYRACWVSSIPPLPRRFRRTAVVFRPAPSPCILRSRVHPIVSFGLLQSSFLQSPARVRRRLERLPWGLVPLHDFSLPSPLSGERPVSAYVPSSAFRTLSTASSSACLAHLFRCAAVSRVLAPGVCLPRSSRDASRHPLPSRRWRRRLPVSRRQRTSRRPQGLAPNRGPQCPAGLLGPRVTRVPSCVFNSCGRWPGDLGSAVALPPLATFAMRGCVSPASLALSVSIDLRAATSLPRGPSRTSFPTFGVGCPSPRGPSVPSGPLRPPTDSLFSSRRASLAEGSSTRNQVPDCLRECHCRRQPCGQAEGRLCRTSCDRRVAMKLHARCRRRRQVCRERAVHAIGPA